jgi:hypothetical protein
MKSILSKSMKYPKGRGRMETTGGSQNTATKKHHHVHNSTTGLHEISTHSIMQTSALFWQTTTTTHDAAVITPTNSSSSNSSSNNNGDAFRPIHAVDMDDDDDDDDSVSSNGASVRDDHDSDVVVVMPHHDQKNDDDDDHRADSPLLWTNAIIGADCRVQVSSPLGEPKEVRFQTTQHDDDDDEALGQESFVLQEQLRNLLQDLSAEKARRFQKEKALVKLAKQLKKRNQQVQSYETKILKMAQFINSLQLELQQQAAAAARDDRGPSPLLPEERTNHTMVTGGPIPTTERPESPEMIPTFPSTERPESPEMIPTLLPTERLESPEMIPTLLPTERLESEQQPQPRQVVVPTTTTLPTSAVSLKNIIEAEDDAAIATRGRRRRSFRLWTLGSDAAGGGGSNGLIRPVFRRRHGTELFVCSHSTGYDLGSDRESSSVCGTLVGTESWWSTQSDCALHILSPRPPHIGTLVRGQIGDPDTLGRPHRVGTWSRSRGGPIPSDPSGDEWE